MEEFLVGHSSANRLRSGQRRRFAATLGRVFVSMIAALFVVYPFVGEARGDEDVPAWRIAIDAGNEAYKAGNFETALGEFARAWNLAPVPFQPEIAAKAARSAAEAGLRRQFDEWLGRAGNEIDADERPRLELRLESVVKARSVVPEKPLQPPPDPAVVPPMVGVQPSSRMSGRRGAGLALLGVGIAAGVGAGIAGWQWWETHREFEARCGRSGGCPDLVDRYRLTSTIAIGGGVLSGVSILTGVLLALPPARAPMNENQAGVDLRWSTGPGQLGIACSGRF